MVAAWMVAWGVPIGKDGELPLLGRQELTYHLQKWVGFLVSAFVVGCSMRPVMDKRGELWGLNVTGTRIK